MTVWGVQQGESSMEELCFKMTAYFCDLMYWAHDWASPHLYMGAVLGSYIEYTQFFLSSVCFNINVCLNYVAALYFPAGQCGVIKLSFRLTENLVNFQVSQRIIVSQNIFFTTSENHSFFLQHACYIFYSPGTNLIQKIVSWKCFIVPFSCFSPCQRQCIILKEWIFFLFCMSDSNKISWENFYGVVLTPLNT